MKSDQACDSAAFAAPQLKHGLSFFFLSIGSYVIASTHLQYQFGPTEGAVAQVKREAAESRDYGRLSPVQSILTTFYDPPTPSTARTRARTHVRANEKLHSQFSFTSSQVQLS